MPLRRNSHTQSDFVSRSQSPFIVGTFKRVNELAETLAEREGVNASEIRARWESEIPMKRLGDPKEFAALAAFLVSERASYITGSSIAVDGGWIRSLV